MFVLRETNMIQTRVNADKMPKAAGAFFVGRENWVE